MLYYMIITTVIVDFGGQIFYRDSVINSGVSEVDILSKCSSFTVDVFVCQIPQIL